MLSKTTVSRGFLTVVPKEIRRASGISEGDVLEWAIEGDAIIVRSRRRVTIEDIVSLGSHGGDAVADKRRVARGQRARR